MSEYKIVYEGGTGEIVEKKSSLIIRQMIFDNYSVLNPIYDK